LSAENAEAGEGPVPFDLDFAEVGLVYGLLYTQSIVELSPSDLMDEIEKRELFANNRAAIPLVIETKLRLLTDMRDYMTAHAGEEEVLKMEAQIRALLKNIP
jgi:hypothetical protein